MTPSGSFSSRERCLLAFPRALAGFALLFSFFASATARADSVTLLSTRIALRDCTIQAISGAQVFYLDPTGQRQKRAIDEVWALGFDHLDALDAAEKAIADRKYDEARKKLLEAFVTTDSQIQQLWIRHRLVRVHGLLDQYAEACSNLAEVFMLDPDQSWARSEPKCGVTASTYPAAVEAIDALNRAKRAVKIQALQKSIGQMLEKVKPLEEELKATYDGPPIEPSATISGIDKALIGKWDAVEEAAEANEKPIEEPKPQLPVGVKPPSQPIKPTTQTPTGPDSPHAIDALLKEHRFDEALTLCEKIAAKIDERDLAQFLYQYGEALRHTGKYEDAAIMYLRAAVLFPASEQAGPCLIETAILYRDEFGRPSTAKHLLERVANDAQRAERTELAERARSLLKTVDHATP